MQQGVRLPKSFLGHCGLSGCQLLQSMGSGWQVVQANSTLSLEREAAIINAAALESAKAQATGALDFDLQVQDMSKVGQHASPPAAPRVVVWPPIYFTCSGHYPCMALPSWPTGGTDVLSLPMPEAWWSAGHPQQGPGGGR